MDKSRKENNRKSASTNADFCNFIKNEKNERNKIKKNSKIFKKIIDVRKENEFERIERESRKRQQKIAEYISDLEKALCVEDSEQIKSALENMNI